MSKILDYIVKGQGLGVKFLLIFSVIIAFFFGLYIKSEGTDMLPYAQQVADQMLPVKIENGVVVEPANTVRTASVSLDNSGTAFELPFVIDTTTDVLDTARMQEGIYLTRRNLYSVQRNQSRIVRLEGCFDLPRGDYIPQFRSILNWTALIAGLAAVAFCFVFYFLLSIFYAFCASAVTGLAKKKLDFDQRMRLAVLCLIAAYILFYFLELLGAGNSQLLFFMVVILFEAVLIHKLRLSQPSAAAETAPQQEKSKE